MPPSLSDAQVRMLRRAAGNEDEGEAIVRRGQHSTAHVLSRLGYVDGPYPVDWSRDRVRITPAGRAALGALDAA